MASIKAGFETARKELEKEGKVEYYARGQRSVVYTCTYKGRKSIAKVEKKESNAKFRLENEAKWLKALNKKGIGPELYACGTGYIVCEFIKGKRIAEWLSSAKAGPIKKALLGIFSQCRVMDKMLVTKEEMHRPLKHIILFGGKPRMIDFERCHSTEKPQNVTQFCQFLMSRDIHPILEGKGIKFSNEKLIALLRQYRETPDEKAFLKLVSLLRLQ
ncbi:MAG TPA: hypothetical protein HA362_00060 [Nanoarchaeota archaeon]|nr:hypothetical protein [Nanoarchaeota archaeon]